MGKMFEGIYLRHIERWYNPFFLNGYELKNIHFFDETGIRLSTGRGWFGNNNNVNGGLTVLDKDGKDIDVERKRKPNFKLNHAFLIPIKREWYVREGKFAELYLPYNRFQWVFEEDGVIRNYQTETYYYDKYDNLTLDVTLEKRTRIEEKTEIIQYIAKVTELIRLGTGNKDAVSQYHVVDNRAKIEDMIQNWNSNE